MSDRFSKSFFGDKYTRFFRISSTPSKVDIFRNCGLVFMKMRIFFHFILLYCALAYYKLKQACMQELFSNFWATFLGQWDFSLALFFVMKMIVLMITIFNMCCDFFQQECLDPEFFHILCYFAGYFYLTLWYCCWQSFSCSYLKPSMT